MKPKKIINDTKFMRVFKIFCEMALDFIDMTFRCLMILNAIDADTATKALDELDHITLGKIDFYHHTDYERDLLVATVMRRK